MVLLVRLASQQSLILTVLYKEMDSCTSAMTMATGTIESLKTASYCEDINAIMPPVP